MIRREFFANFLRQATVGAIASVAPEATKKLDVVVEKEVRLERHQFQESIDLLNRMRKAGGVREISKGRGDNGQPIGEIPDTIMRHTDFGRVLNEMHTDGYDFDESAVPRAVPGAQVAPGTRLSAEPGHKKHVRTLQEEMFGG